MHLPCCNRRNIKNSLCFHNGILRAASLRRKIIAKPLVQTLHHISTVQTIPSPYGTPRANHRQTILLYLSTACLVGIVVGGLLFAVSSVLNRIFSLDVPIMALFSSLDGSGDGGRTVAEFRELREKKKRQKNKPKLSLHNLLQAAQSDSRPLSKSFDDIWDLHSPLAAQTILEEELEDSD